MRKLAFIAIASTFIFVSCGNSKKEDVTKTEKAPKTEKVTTQKPDSADAAAGKKLFNSKGCTACHHETTKIIGPPVKEIAAIYLEKKGDVLAFLNGESDAIVDTDATQVSIMKSNLDTMVKDISESDLASIVAYINSVK